VAVPVPSTLPPARRNALESEEVGYAPPVVVEAGGGQLIVWLSDSVRGLDPNQQGPLSTVSRTQTDAARRVDRDPVPDGGLLVTCHHGPLMPELTARNRPARKRGKSDNIEKPDGLHADDDAVARWTHLRRSAWASARPTEDRREAHRPTRPRGQETHSRRPFWCGKRLGWLFNDQGELILAKLSPKGYEELSRAKILSQMPADARSSGRTCVREQVRSRKERREIVACRLRNDAPGPYPRGLQLTALWVAGSALVSARR
jgi:hypothetical protein